MAQRSDQLINIDLWSRNLIIFFFGKRWLGWVGLRCVDKPCYGFTFDYLFGENDANLLISAKMSEFIHAGRLSKETCPDFRMKFVRNERNKTST